MSYPEQLDGERLYNWATRAVAELANRRSEINALNVFPVPDADTGSNMAHTMEAALAEADKLPPADRANLAQVSEALAIGGVRGARGNSGVVLSQVLRALAEAAVGGQGIDGEAIAQGLENAVHLVDRAISEPVEGTVVTVLRAAAVAARHTVNQDAEFVEVLTATVDAARTALAHTPSQLAVLQEAGVVDAGGAGFVVLLEALLAEVTGEQADTGFAELTSQPRPPAERASHGRAESGGIEVMFYFTGPLAQLEEHLQPLGDSLVIARASEDSGTVHIHSQDGGAVIETAYELGDVSDLRLEVLPAGPTVAAPQRTIMALTPPGEIAQLYRDAGAVVVEKYGETESSSELVGSILTRIRQTGADEVILLPNGLLTRRQLAAIDKATNALDQTIALLTTSRLVSGIAAVAVHDGHQPMATAAYTMSEAAHAMRTAVIVQAERAALTSAGPCAKGDFLVEAHGQIITVCDTPAQAFYAASRHLLDAGGEQVTILSDLPIDLEELSNELRVTVMVYPGGGLNVAAEIGVE